MISVFQNTTCQFDSHSSSFIDILIESHHPTSDIRQNLCVRSGIRTHARKTGLRPERSALDRSAILTAIALILTATFSHLRQEYGRKTARASSNFYEPIIQGNYWGIDIFLNKFVPLNIELFNSS